MSQVIDSQAFGQAPFAPIAAADERPLQSLRRFARSVRRRALLAVTVASVGSATAALIAWGLPPVYRSSATILIEQQALPRELVRSTVTGFAEQRIREIEQRTLISANLREIMDRHGVYAGDRESQPLEVLVQRMRDDVDVAMVSADVVDPQSGRATEATIAFRLAFEAASPQQAQRVASELTTLFLGENLQQRSALAEEASRFLSDEAAKAETQLQDVETSIAAFKARHLGQLPEDTANNLQTLAGADTALRTAERETTVLTQQLDFLRGQLAAGTASTGGVRQRLADLETAQAAFTARYAPSHPTLLAAQRELSALRDRLASSPEADGRSDTAELARSLEAKRSALGPVHPEVRALERALQAARDEAGRGTPASDPLTTELRRQIALTEGQLAAASITRAAAMAQVDRSSTRVSATPGIESEYRTLLRDRDQAQRKVQSLRDRLAEADVSRALEADQKGERFTLIEPAEQPQNPIKPNRRLLLVVGIVFALLAAAAAVTVRESFDDSIRDARDLLAATGVTALSLLPHATSPAELAARTRQRRQLLAGGAVAALLALAAVGLVASGLAAAIVARLWS